MADTPHPAASEWVTVGRINGLYGVHGAVRLFSYMDEPADILGFDCLWLPGDGRREPRRVLEAFRKGPRLIARLEGIGSREAARELLDAPLQVPREALEGSEEDEFLWADLLGLAVETVDGTPLGRVDHLIETGANDVLVVAGSDRERLIPFTAEHVPTVDLQRGLIRVDWDPEL